MTKKVSSGQIQYKSIIWLNSVSSGQIQYNHLVVAVAIILSSLRNGLNRLLSVALPTLTQHRAVQPVLFYNGIRQSRFTQEGRNFAFIGGSTFESCQ